jgi:hypothetical protein
MACSGGDAAPPSTTPAVQEKACENCPCYDTAQCNTGLACDREHFSYPGTCVPEVPYLECYSAPERCECDVEQGAPTDHPSTNGCGDLPSAWGGDGDYLCCADAGYPDSGICICDKLPAPDAFTCADYAGDPLVEVAECKTGPYAPPPGGGTIGGGGGGSGSGGSSSVACDSEFCRGSTECAGDTCVTCSKHCSKDGCIDDGCSNF